MPQPPPGLHAAALDEVLEPLVFKPATNESWRSTCWLPQEGQATSLILEALMTNSSKSSLQSSQIKPYIGII
jgi:hypothetical protein